MDYKSYNTEDLLNDESFVNWVVDPGNNTASHWERFLEDYPDKREEFQVAIGLISNVRPNLDENRINELTDRIWVTLEDKLELKSGKKGSFISRAFSSQWLQIAATLLIVTGLSLLLNNYLEISDQPDAQVATTLIKKSNPKGRKSTITLSDKTKVILNAESSIEYLDNFSSDKREISLVGEAFFDVARDESRPFVIKVNGIGVRVLGTSFNVKAYSGSKDMQVAVMSGNVEVYDQERKNVVNLVKDEMVDFQYSSKDFDKRQITDRELVFAWIDQKLVFKNQDLESLMGVLSRWYGVEIDYSGVINKKKEVTGSYQNVSLREVMVGLSHNYDFEYEINGKQVRIYNK